jgi:uncharacterized protein YutE (UPF0331/DUF86 family)
LPKNSSDNFQLLADANIITLSMHQHLIGMVGFRNILVHEYTKVDLTIVINVVENHLEKLIDFAQCIVLQFTDRN